MKASFVLASLLPAACASALQTFSQVAQVGNNSLSLSPEGTYPRLAWLSDGSILASYSMDEIVGNTTSRNLKVIRSTDRGKSFNPQGTIVTKGAGDTDNAFLLEVPATRGSQGQTAVLAAYRNHDMNEDGEYTYYRISISISHDNGETWRFLTDATEGKPSEDFLGVWEPFMRLGPHGDVQLTYSKTLAPDNQVSYRQVSYFGGAYWTEPECLVCHEGEVRVRDGMQSIVEVKDRKTGQDALVIVYETTRDDKTGRAPYVFMVQCAVSYDDGDTWGPRQTVYAPEMGYNAGAPYITSYADGGLIVLFMTDEDTNHVFWPNDGDIKAVSSKGVSGGKIEFTEPVTLDSNVCHWEGALTMNDKEVLGVWTHGDRVVGKMITQR